MIKHLNDEIYQRFGVQVDKRKVENGFRKHMVNKAWEFTYPLRYPDFYKDPFDKYVTSARNNIIEKCCREMFLDSSNYEYHSYDTSRQYISNFLKVIFDNSGDSFEDVLVKIQILLNISYREKVIREEFDVLVKEIEKYTEDFPMLGITIKRFKNKAPQIFPTTSEKFKSEITNTLGLLESDKKYKDCLTNYENGLKEFLIAKNQSGYKDVIEDMYTACDELVKAVTGSKSKGFRHISDKQEAVLLQLNGHQKELYKNLRNWLDEIKHGTKKDFDRKDTEMIISMCGSLIRFVISKQK